MRSKDELIALAREVRRKVKHEAILGPDGMVAATSIVDELIAAIEAANFGAEEV